MLDQAMDHSKYRQARVEKLVAKKIAEIQPDLDKIKSNSDMVNGKISKLNSELSNI